jgi:hypothetical protein
MALVMETATRNALANAIDDAVNAGTAQTGGKLVIETSADAEVSLHRFANPAFGPAAAGVISANSLPIDDTSAAGGTAAQYSIYDRDDTKLLEGVVAVTGQDLDLSSLSVGVGDTVSLTAFTITQPA